jgi:hypothetical protein
MNPTELLQAARDLVERPDRVTAGLWPRASAFLARQAFEEAIDDLWRSSPGFETLLQRSTATQLLCLRLVVDDTVAAEAAYLWSVLSSACHYHPIDLAPTAAELEGWFDDVDELISNLAATTSLASAEAS